MPARHLEGRSASSRFSSQVHLVWAQLGLIWEGGARGSWREATPQPRLPPGKKGAGQEGEVPGAAYPLREGR